MIRSVSLLLVGCLLADPVAASVQGIVSSTPAPGLYTSASPLSLYNDQALEPFLNWMRNPLEWDAIRALGSSIAEAWKDFTDQFPHIEVLEAETVGSFSNFPIIEFVYKMKKTTGGSGSGNITRKQETVVAKFVGDLTLEQLEDVVRIKWGQNDIQTSRSVREMLQHLLQRYPDSQERLRIRAEAYRQAEALYPQRLNEAKQAFMAGLTEANLQELVRMKLGMEDPPISSDVVERLQHLLQYYPNSLERLRIRGEIYREAEALLAPRMTEAKQTFLAGLSESEQHELLFIKVGRDTSDTSAALRQKLNHVLQISPDPEQQFTVRTDIYAEAAALIAQRIPTVVLKFLAGLTTEEIHELIMIKLGRDTPEHFAALHQKLNHLYQPYADPDQQKAVYTELYHQAYVLSAVRREGEVLKKVLAPRPGGTPRPPEVLMEVGGSLIQELATEYTSADVEGRAPLVDALALIIMIWWDEHPRENHYEQTMSRQPRDRRNYIPDLVLQRCERVPDPAWGVEVFTLLAEKYTHRDDVARFLVARGDIFARSETLQKAFEPMLLEISAAHPKLLAIRIMESRSAGKSDAVNQWLDHLLLLHAEHSSVPVIVRTLLRLIDYLKLGTVTPGTLLILDTENDGPLTEVSVVERLGPKAMVAWMQSMIIQIAQLSPAHKRTVIQQIEKRIQRLHQVDGEELLRHVRGASTTKQNGGTFWWMAGFYQGVASIAGNIAGWIVTPFLAEGLMVWLSSGFLHLALHEPFTTDHSNLLWVPLLAWLAGHMGNPTIFSQRDRNQKEFFNSWRWAMALLSMGAYFLIGHFTHGPVHFWTLGLIIGIPHLIIQSIAKYREWTSPPVTETPVDIQPIPQKTKPVPAKTIPVKIRRRPSRLPAPVVQDPYAGKIRPRKFPVKVKRIIRAGLHLQLTQKLWHDGLLLTQNFMDGWKAPRATWEFSFFGQVTAEEFGRFQHVIVLDSALMGDPVDLTHVNETAAAPPSKNAVGWFPLAIGYQARSGERPGQPYERLRLKNQGLVCLWTAFQAEVNSHDAERQAWLRDTLRWHLQLSPNTPVPPLDPLIAKLREVWSHYELAEKVARSIYSIDLSKPLTPKVVSQMRTEAMDRLQTAVDQVDALLYRASLPPPSEAAAAELDKNSYAREQALRSFHARRLNLKKSGWDGEYIQRTFQWGLIYSSDLTQAINYERWFQYVRPAHLLLEAIQAARVVTPDQILQLLQILNSYESAIVSNPATVQKIGKKLEAQFPASRWADEHQRQGELRERLAALIHIVEVAPGQRWILLSLASFKKPKDKRYYIVAPVRDWTMDLGVDNKNLRIVAEDDPWFAPFLPLLGPSSKSLQSTPRRIYFSLMESLVLAAVLLPISLGIMHFSTHDRHHVPNNSA